MARHRRGGPRSRAGGHGFRYSVAVPAEHRRCRTHHADYVGRAVAGPEARPEPAVDAFFSANADAIVAVVAGGEEISCSEEVARLREVWAALREAAAEGVLDTSGAHPHQQNAERALVVLVDSEGARDYGEEGCPIVRPQFREAPAALLQAGVPPDSMLRVDARSGEGVSDLMARICDAVSRRREAEGRSSSLCVVGAGVQEECLFVGAGGCEEVLQVQRS